MHDLFLTHIWGLEIKKTTIEKKVSSIEKNMRAQSCQVKHPWQQYLVFLIRLFGFYIIILLKRIFYVENYI